MKDEQLPRVGTIKRKILDTVYEHFKGNDRIFEFFAARIAEMMDRNLRVTEVTRQHRDGGRDALGHYKVGHDGDQINLEFALEAKCYNPDSSIRVNHTSRLISRLRYRQFGIFVTTASVARQAYQEIRDDNHPVIIISGGDIVTILEDAGYSTPDSVQKLLQNDFPRSK
ncbi:MAG: restriction endonuclease [Candidatus Thorarchaeota archaeon]